jgi:hypothetical protein
VHTGRISKFERGEFVLLDGEGITTSTRTESRKSGGIAIAETIEEQAYVLLANSNGEHLYDNDGIGTVEAFDFLLAGALSHPRAIHCLYAGGYDCAMILKDLSRWQLKNLHNGEWVRYREYKIQYRPGRSLFICRTHPDESRRESVTIYDVFGFFNTAFIKALDRWCPNHPDRALIAHGKSERGQFRHEDKQFLIEYNAAELRAFADLMKAFHTALKETGCVLARWDGPGALAAAMMRKHDVHSHMARRTITLDTGVKHDIETVPAFVRPASRPATAGGRNECLKIGNHQDDVWRGDINSAYPADLRDVPSLAGGGWERHHSEPSELQRFALYHLTWDRDNDHPIHPFFYRDPQSHISFPSAGEGWYWGPEVIAAVKHDPTGIAILEWIEFHPANDERPFAFIEAEAERKLRYRQEGHGAEMPIKLSLNSLYGKTAQQVGGRYTPDGRLLLPRYFQPEWAGYVTSSCRARVYDTAMHDPDSIIQIATDGIYATRPLPVPEGVGLGEWRTDVVPWMISVQSGVYFVGEDGETHAWHRGFDASSISPDRVIEAWRMGQRSLECTTTRFVSLGTALKTPHGIEDHWRTWRTGPRTLRLDGHGTKRTQLSTMDLRRAAEQLIDTRPIPNPLLGECSAPAKVAWDL